MKTGYERYLEIKNSDECGVEMMRFYFKNSVLFAGAKVTKAACGLNVKQPHKSFYAEYSADSQIILLYPSKHESCCGEIVLDDFINNLKKTHDLLRA